MTHPRQDPTRRCRPVAEWPESDRSAWATAQSAGDILDPGGPAAAWAPHTRRGVVSGWGHFLTWLDQAGELRAEETPGARITPPRLTAYVDALRQRGNAIQTILSRLHQLDRFLAAVAPGQDCTPLRRMQARLRGEPHDPGSKRARLRFSRELFDLGTRLMAVAESSPSTARQRAVDYRDGLMIALLAARPLRRRNFVRLELGRHLVHDQGSWRLQVPGEETKTGRPIALPFPTALAPALERYLAVHRPVLAALRGRWHQPAGTALWLSAHGSPITEMTFYDRIRQLTAAAFGAAVNPHLFRDAAATSLAIQDPAQVRIAAQILGHGSFATTERHYNLARSLDAGQAWQATLDRLRG